MAQFWAFCSLQAPKCYVLRNPTKLGLGGSIFFINFLDFGGRKMLVINNKYIVNQLIISKDLIIHCTSFKNEDNLDLKTFINERSENNLVFDLDENETRDGFKEISCNNYETFFILIKEFFGFNRYTVLDILETIFYGEKIELTCYAQSPSMRQKNE